LESEFEVRGDAIYDLRAFDEGDNTHLTPTGRIEQGIGLIDLLNHLRPASGWDKQLLLFNDRKKGRIDLRILPLWALE